VGIIGSLFCAITPSALLIEREDLHRGFSC
jgi:hypothetical protein